MENENSASNLQSAYNHECWNIANFTGALHLPYNANENNPSFSTLLMMMALLTSLESSWEAHLYQYSNFKAQCMFLWYFKFRLALYWRYQAILRKRHCYNFFYNVPWTAVLITWPRAKGANYNYGFCMLKNLLQKQKLQHVKTEFTTLRGCQLKIQLLLLISISKYMYFVNS